MKTPKEKAEELHYIYVKKIYKRTLTYSDKTAKQCALIVVNEIIDAIDWHEFETPNKQLEYWENVKIEIEKL